MPQATRCAKCKRDLAPGREVCLWCGTSATSAAPPAQAAAPLPQPNRFSTTPAIAPPPPPRMQKPERTLCPLCMSPVPAAEIITHGGVRMCESCSNRRAKAGGREGAPGAPVSGTPSQAVADPGGPRNPCPIRQHSECMSLKVKVTVPSVLASFNPESQGFEGKADLEVSEKGLRVTMTGLFSNKKSVEVCWDRIREMKNDLRTKRRFEADFGGRLLRVKLQAADASRLATLFARLPADVSGERCPWCGGLSLNGTCRSCKRSPGSYYRTTGFWAINGGALLTALGGGISWVSYSATAPGNKFTIFTGIMMLGFVTILGGIYQFLFGKNSRV